MKAYIRVIYSSEGRSPAEVAKIMKDLGFHKVKGQPLFEGEVADDAALDQMMEQLHIALKGMEVRYIPTLLGMEGAPANLKDMMRAWKDMGWDVDRLKSLLETDPPKFRHEVMGLMKAEVDEVVSQREKELAELEQKHQIELQEREERERAEKQAKHIQDLLAQEGGVTFHQLHDDTKLDSEELGELIKDMVDKGSVRALQRGRRVVYISA